MKRACSAAVLLALCACDSLITRPSLYGTVDVTVRRRDGDVISGAQVELYTSARPMGYAVTDAKGFHQFVDVPEGIYGVRAVPPEGYMRMEDLLAFPPTDVIDDLTLTGGKQQSTSFFFLKKGYGTIVADVTEPGGKPVTHQVVSLYTAGTSPRTATTDAAGRATFDSVRYGNYGVISQRSAAYLDSGETPFLTRDGLVVDDGAVLAAHFEFVPCAGSITALVRDDTGKPVPGTSIALYNSQQTLSQSVADGNGALTFPNLTCDNFGVRVQPPIGWSAVTGRGTSFADGLFVHRNRTTTTTLNVQVVTCRGAVRATATDNTGVPLANVPIILYTSDQVYRSVTTGSDGVALMNQIPCDREYGLSVSPTAGFSVVNGRGTSFFDGIIVSAGATVNRAFVLTRGP